MKSFLAKILFVTGNALALSLASSTSVIGEGKELPGDLAAYAALGHVVGDKIYLNELQWTEEQFEAFALGLRRHFMGAAQVELDQRSRAVFVTINKSIEEAQMALTEAGQMVAAIKKLAATMSMESLAEGGYMRIVIAGSGARPRPDDTIVVSLSASSVETGDELPGLSLNYLRTKVSGLLPGLALGLQRLTLESEALILVPPELSFGSGSWPKAVAPGTHLMFKVRLHEIYAVQ